jgi:hypothetical protein
MSERERRVGLNEAVFREVNERIEDLAERFDLEDQPLDLVCECGNGDCTERISMSHSEYEEIRADAKQFAVFPGHLFNGVEEIVAHRNGYDVVRKRQGEAAELAETSNPRH